VTAGCEPGAVAPITGRDREHLSRRRRLAV